MGFFLFVGFVLEFKFKLKLVSPTTSRTAGSARYLWNYFSLKGYVVNTGEIRDAGAVSELEISSALMRSALHL